MNIRLFTAAAAVAFLSASASAHASTIVYNLTNVGLTAGVNGPADGNLNGSFTLTTTSSPQLTALNIVASAGTSGGGFDFILGGLSANSTIVTESSTLFEISASGGNNVLELRFGSALNGSGPDTIVSGSYEDEVAGVGLRNVGSGYSATLGAAVAPEPSSIALLGSGLLAAGGLLRRRRAQLSA